MDISRVGTGVIGVFIDALGWDQTLAKLSEWSAGRESRYLCFCNVHSVVTANQDETFRRAIKGADMATPDGMPVAWMLRRLGFKEQQRISGPDFMWKYCGLAEKRAESVYFLGSSEDVLLRLREKLLQAFPKLIIAGHYSPPFRPMTNTEDEVVVTRINESGAGMVFVGLGCPKQEIWMAEHRGRINAVMAGVGAAFAIHAGKVQRAPLWMQKAGLEWVHRLASEPKRLWKRYLVTNTVFMVKSLQQLLSSTASEKRRVSPDIKTISLVGVKKSQVELVAATILQEITKRPSRVAKSTTPALGVLRTLVLTASDEQLRGRQASSFETAMQTGKHKFVSSTFVPLPSLRNDLIPSLTRSRSVAMAFSSLEEICEADGQADDQFVAHRDDKDYLSLVSDSHFLDVDNADMAAHVSDSTRTAFGSIRLVHTRH